MSDRFQALHLLAEYPILCGLARQHTRATKLDGRTIAWIYRTHKSAIDEQALLENERQLMLELSIRFASESSECVLCRLPRVLLSEGQTVCLCVPPA